MSGYQYSHTGRSTFIVCIENIEYMQTSKLYCVLYNTCLADFVMKCCAKGSQAAEADEVACRSFKWKTRESKRHFLLVVLF